jgi:hypothetical protein
MIRDFATLQLSEEPLSAREQMDLVQRIVASTTFSNSPTLRSFLLYVAEHAIAGRLDALKEQQIGAHVLGRRPDYDPAQDNIVRVRARELRHRLEKYFREDGQLEPVLVSIPKGHYVPVFQPRVCEAKPGDLPKVGDASEPPEDVLSPAPEAQQQRLYLRNVLRALPWLLTAVTLTALLVTLFLYKNQQKKDHNSQHPSPAIAHSVWAQMFTDPDQELTFITADAGFALWQDITHHEMNLGDYLNRKYLRESLSDLGIQEIAARRYTSPADLTLSLRLAEIAKALNGKLRVRFARNVDIHDLRSGNLVLAGSRRSNPWIELFEPSMNFVLGGDPKQRGPHFLNRSPKPGESRVFSMASPLEVSGGAEDKSVDSYAIAAMLANPSGQGMVVIVEGLSMEGTEAAGEFVTNPEHFQVFLRRVGLKNGESVKPFEVLLKLTALAGGYANPQVVAYRYPLH